MAVIKRLLFISDTIIKPVDRGNRKRVFNLINMMRERGVEVDFLYLHTYKEEDPSETIDFIGKEHFIVFENKKRSLPVFLKRKVRKVLEILHIPGLFKFWSIDERIDPAITKFMDKLYKEKHYDIIWCEYIYNSKPLLNAPEGAVKVIDTVNAFTFKRQMYEAVGYKNYEFALTKKEEAKGLKRADVVVAIQEAEEEFFKSILPPEIKTVTIGENIPGIEPYVSKSDTILFLGSYYVVNRHGVKHFINNVLPLIKESGVPYKFKLVGSICNHIPDSTEYEKLGFVDDVNEAYTEARLVINPVHVGTGLNLKTIEALSKSKPLVTRSVGVRGLSGHEKFALCSDDDREFAENVIKVLKDDELAESLSKGAAEFIKEYTGKNLDSFNEILNM